jgi:hypothetical protein
MSDEMSKFKITEKKVDQSWKDEVRKERELAKQKAEEIAAAKAGKPAPSAAESAAAAPAAPSAGEAPKAAAPAQPEGEKPKGKAGEPDKASKLFLSFVAQIVQQTLMQMGMMENPYTGQAELNLEAARYSIDLLAVLLQKTKGNLTEQEAKILTDSVRDLQVQYVEIANELNRQMQEQVLKAGKPGGPGGRPGR